MTDSKKTTDTSSKAEQADANELEKNIDKNVDKSDENATTSTAQSKKALVIEAKKVDEKPVEVSTQVQSAKDTTSAKVTKSATASSDKAPRSRPEPQTAVKQKISKLAVFSLLLTLLLAGATAYVGWLAYQWHQEFTAQQTQNQQALTQYKKALENQLGRSLNQAQQTWQQASDNQTQNIKALLDQLAKSYVDVDQEAALIDINHVLSAASRHLWYQNDRKSALALVELAQKRAVKFDGVKDAKWLTLQQHLAEDIGNIQSLPQFDQQAVFFQLSSLAQQVMKLPLNQVKLPEPVAQEEDLALSDSVSDWRSNIAKVWRQLVSDFISVNRRVSATESLLSPQQEANLRQNILSKIVQAQSALLNYKAGVYERSLQDAALWLADYYNMDLAEVAAAHKTLTDIAQFEIAAPLPKLQLQSLKFVRQQLTTELERQQQREERIEKEVEAQVEAVEQAAEQTEKVIEQGKAAKPEAAGNEPVKPAGTEPEVL
ncbi:uroporphyrinogen-III C-methyltransferase [Catenovulum sp. SM1970]|uniref:uroporphyrinogen-III C-methyltransferase n=1 Tax=Marinifaba aquimaris TaxID=2741323 RepID=UPI001574833A|nr:uroporphyrinogen-III C-methyltransferase [Marinifaba aquimaris]NTS76758.1 uroporphyrinogen-III C-methyltransferase [Marinifaba aquimaris]